VLSAGAQSQAPGPELVSIAIPHSLAGSGEVPVVLIVDGQSANVVTINLQ
jgi:hypothetical protein